MYQLKQKLRNWPPAEEVTILRKKLLTDVDAGYIRMRVQLQDGHLLEVSEYVSVETGRLIRTSYSYHWQDRTGKLIQRWDNAPHHPHVKTYPYHTHLQEESNIIASEEMTIDKILKMIASNMTLTEEK